jgi:hypothetical protein
LWAHRVHPDIVFKPVWASRSPHVQVSIIDEEVVGFIEEHFKHIERLLSKVISLGHT